MAITLSGFVIPISLMLLVCFVESLLWHKTSPRLLISHHIFLTNSFVLILTHVGKSDHMVVGVDMQFVVKSTNEHPYHRTVYSHTKADWNGLIDHLRDMPWLGIFKHDATYAAKEITEWVEIDIDCYIPCRKFQLKPHSSPWFTPCAASIAHCNHHFHQYHQNATPENKKLFCDSRNHCKKVLSCEVQLC